MEQSSDEPQIHSVPAEHKGVPERSLATGIPLPWARTKMKINSFLEKWGRPPAIEFSDAYLESVQANLWAVSPEREWYMFRRPKVFIAAMVGVGLVLVAAVLAEPSSSESERWWALVVTVGAISVLIYCTLPYWAARRAFSERRAKTASYRAEIALKRLATADSIPFPELFSYNRRQLDAYQEESRNQQRLAFRQAQRATIAGLIILTVGIILSFGQSFGAAQYAAAGLAGLGAALSTFIANTFAKSAREANQQLNLYSREPHMVGRVMVTEHLAQGLSDEFKREQLSAMIATLLAWPLPCDPPTLQGDDPKVE